MRRFRVRGSRFADTVCTLVFFRTRLLRRKSDVRRLYDFLLVDYSFSLSVDCLTKTIRYAWPIAVIFGILAINHAKFQLRKLYQLFTRCLYCLQKYIRFDKYNLLQNHQVPNTHGRFTRLRNLAHHVRPGKTHGILVVIQNTIQYASSASKY